MRHTRTLLPVVLLTASCTVTGEPPAEPVPRAVGADAIDLGPVTVRGLRPGETATLLAPGSPPAASDVARGRVVDAFTARPVAGATIELWSEEIDAYFGGFHRFGVATNGPDGRYAVRRREGGRTAGKLRVAAPGYLTLTEAAGIADGVVRLFPAEAEPPRLLLVDLQGRPIPGARVTSTFTCAHDVPALDVTSGADGVAVLADWGLQDRVPELRVLAPGFAGIKYLDGEPILAAASRVETYTRRLRRTPGTSGSLLDTDGTPLADEPLHVLDGDGFHVVRTDEAGRFELPARYDDGELMLQLLSDDERGAAYGVAATSMSRRRNGVPVSENTLRYNGEDPPGDLPTGRVRLVFEHEHDGASAEGLEVRTMDGWSDTVDEEGRVELPLPTRSAPDGSPAQVTAFVANPSGTLLGMSRGRPVYFENYGPERSTTLGSTEPRTIRLPLLLPVVAGEEREVTIHTRFGRRAALLPAGVAESVVVEQGARSVVYTAHDDGTLDAWLWTDAPFTLWFPDTDVVRKADAMIVGDDLDALITELTAAAERAAMPAPSGRTQVRVPEDAELTASSILFGEVAVTRDGDGTLIEGPRGPALVRYEREGHAVVWSRALLGVGGARAPAAPAYTSLELDGALSVEGYEDLDELAALHPGPFHCVAQLADDLRVGLRLELRAGEERVLRLVD